MKWLLLLVLFFTVSTTYADIADQNSPVVEELSPLDNIPYGFGWWGWGPGPVIGMSVYPGFAYGYSFVNYYTYRPLPYAAIAYSRSADKFGYSWGDWDRSRSEANALWACAEADCVSVVWVQGGCAAVSTRVAEGRLGWGYAVDLYRAKANALRGCRRGASGPCEIRAWACAE